MGLNIGLWRVDDVGKPTAVPVSAIALESQLEDLIEADPTILGDRLLLVGRQVPTAHGKFIDLLAVDADGVLHVLELKRDKTPRDVVAQLLDYGSWIQGLSHDDVLSIFATYKPDAVSFEAAFDNLFAATPPQELNTSHRLTVVAGDIDPSTGRIIEYLAGYAVPINVVFFRYFTDGELTLLARTWLIDDLDETAASKPGKQQSSKEPWNGRDWYINFGEESGVRDWDDAREFGFVSAGGGPWYSGTMRSVPVGARVFVCIPSKGYVGVGEVIGEAMTSTDAVVERDGQMVPFAGLPLRGSYVHASEAEGTEEYVIPVRWTKTLDRDAFVWEKGMFANQNSACRLRNKFTLERLVERFDLHDD